MLEAIKILYRRATNYFMAALSLCVVLQVVVVLYLFGFGDFFQHFRLRYSVAGAFLLTVAAALAATIKYYCVDRRSAYK